jgi:hypothetical protein
MVLNTKQTPEGFSCKFLKKQDRLTRIHALVTGAEDMIKLQAQQMLHL